MGLLLELGTDYQECHSSTNPPLGYDSLLVAQLYLAITVDETLRL